MTEATTRHAGQQRFRLIDAPHARLRPKARKIPRAGASEALTSQVPPTISFDQKPSDQGEMQALSKPNPQIRLRSAAFAAVALGILLTLSFLLGWLAQSVMAVGQREDYYLRSFQKYRVWEDAGISEEDAARIARALPQYLTGDTQALSLEITLDGETQPAFHADELAHMADVRGLFVLAERLLLVCAVCFAVLVILLLVWRSHWDLRLLWRAVLWTMAGGLACFLALAVWAAVDFSSLFTLFHQLSFSNDLWLMNPATDLMIRLMPQDMFFDGMLSIGLWLVGGLLAYLLAAWAFCHLPRRAKEAQAA